MLKVSRGFTLPFKEKTLSHKCAYKHYFWVSELNKPSEHSVDVRIHLNGQESLGLMGQKSTARGSRGMFVVGRQTL